MKPDILICVGYPEDQLDLFRQRFTVHYAPTPAELEEAIDRVGDRIRGAVTTGSYGLKGSQMDRLPRLEIVAIRGVGTENVDLEKARQRGITVSNCPGINFFSVAEHAVAIMLSAVRRVPQDHIGIHAGQWQATKNGPMRSLIFRKRLGILGLGSIGKGIADRVQGFEMSIGYHNRNRRDDVAHTYYPSVLELCRNSDILVIAAPGGAGTRGIVDAEALAALGPDGYLVNVGRGSIVDQAALIAALKEKRLAGAALDVVDGEPEVPQELLDMPNVVLTPHIGGNSVESRLAAIAAVGDNLQAKFEGRPVENRIV